MSDQSETYPEPEAKSEKPSSYEISSEFEGKYFALVENAPDIIFTVDLKGNFLYLNKTSQKITGYPLFELQKRNLQNFVASEYHDLIEKILHDHHKIQAIPYIEVEVISSNRTRIPLDIHIKPIKDTKGRVAALMGIARDVTERKKLVEAMRESEKIYSTLVEHAKDGVVIIQDGICKFANKAASEISGYSLDELVGKSLFEKLPSENRELIAERYKQRLANKNVPPVYEIKIPCKDGTIKDVEISAAVIQYEGRPADMAFVRDITERKMMEDTFRESEEKYRLLVENINDVIFTLDIKGNITYISPAVEQYDNYKADEIRGQPISRFVHQEDLPELLSTIEKTLDGHQETLEFRLLEEDDKVRHVRASTRVMLADNRPAGIMGILTDISEQKTAMEKINKAYKEAKEAKAKLSAIINSAPNIAIQEFNKNGDVLTWNPFSEKLFGIREAEVRGKSLKGLLSTETEEENFKKLLKNSFLENKPSPLVEFSTTTKKGEVKYILSSVFPIILPGEEPRAVALSIEITDSKNAVEKIKEMNRQLERFSEISADILSIEDEKELFEHIAQAVVDISDFNRVLISYFKVEPPYREIIGHKGVKEEDLKRVKKIEMPKEKYKKYFEKGIKIGNQSCYIPYKQKEILDQNAVIPGEKSYPAKKGHWHREDNLLVSMKDTRGELIGIISVDDSKSGLIPTEETVRPLEIFANLISEIIQRRKLSKKISESQEKYRELVSNIKVGVFRATPESDLLEANPSAVDMFDYEDAEEFLNLKMVDLIQNPDKYVEFVEEIEENGTIKNKELMMKRKNDTSFWASITSAAVKNPSGKIIYYDTVIEDITERKKLQEEVKRLSVTDELTGLYNRRYFNQYLHKEIKNVSGWKSALSLIMIDIDDFKHYNDAYHHLEGDEIIKKIARVILRNIRKDFDWASRFGGEEFAIILPGATASEAIPVAERIKNQFQEIRFRPRGDTIQKTISLGIAQCSYTQDESRYFFKDKGFFINYEKIATDLINLADKALFKAKKSGKNRISVSEQSIALNRKSI